MDDVRSVAGQRGEDLRSWEMSAGRTAETTT